MALNEAYHKVRPIGKGAFGLALLIRRKADNKKLVAKSFPVGNASERSSAAREIEILKRLSHPNIIRYCDHLEEEDGIYLVMEYAAGGDLRARILQKKGNGRFPQTDVVAWFSQLLLAVKHLHDCKILHRDIKPANIFFTSKSVVKLGDFGLTKVLEGTTVATTCCGTPYFFSPEIVEKVPYNSKSDMWAVGCMLYEMMMLQHPFQGASMKALYEAIRTVKFIPLDDYYDPALEKMVVALLVRDHAQRASVEDMLAMPLPRQYLENYSVPTASPPPSPVAPKAAQRTSSSPSQPSWMHRTLNSKRDRDIREQIEKMRADLRARKGHSPGLPPLEARTRPRPGPRPGARPTADQAVRRAVSASRPRSAGSACSEGEVVERDMREHISAILADKRSPLAPPDSDLAIVERCIHKSLREPALSRALRLLRSLGRTTNFTERCTVYDRLLTEFGAHGPVQCHGALHRLVFQDR